jgi:hypothetical protein
MEAVLAGKEGQPGPQKDQQVSLSNLWLRGFLKITREAEIRKSSTAFALGYQFW